MSRLGPSALAATADEDEPTVYAIAAALDEASGGSTFVRGLAVGALVGAAIAGSLIRMRIRRRRRRPHQLSRSGPGEPGHGPVTGSAAVAEPRPVDPPGVPVDPQETVGRDSQAGAVPGSEAPTA